jgi:hypothetical protein
MRLLLPAFVLLAVGSAAGVAHAADEGEKAAPPRIYRWVDANGVAHYTTDEGRIPASLRRRFGLPTQPLEQKPLDARAPGAEAPAPQTSAPVPVPVPQTSAPSAGVDAWVSQERSEAPPPAAAAPAAPREEWQEGEAPLPPVSAGTGGDRLSQVELRIAELSAAIAADEDQLSAWIGDPAAADSIELGEKPEFREIASRLPKRIQELEALQRERDALESATP